MGTKTFAKTVTWTAPLALLLFFSAISALAQPVGVPEIDDPVHRFLLRQQAAGLLDGAHLSHLPLSGGEILRYLDTLSAHQDALSATDRHLLARYRYEAPAPGATWANRALGGPVYRNGQNLFEIAGPTYSIRIDPLLFARYGSATQTEREGREGSVTAWQYGRGARLSGTIGKYFFFDSRLTENAARPVRNQLAMQTAPRLAFVEWINDGYDWFGATANVGVRTDHFEIRFGHDRNRWGFPAASALLSNYASAYDQLQIRTTVGPFQYVNLFAGLSEPRLRPPADVAIPRKYMAAHRLSIDLPARIQLGLFETVIFSTDTLGVRNNFDLSYLNPIIFYRAAERDRGSPDNVLLGGDFAWTVLPGARVYGQLLLDEMQFRQIGKGWWANKWAWVAGLQTADLLPGLSARAEYARIRPFIYTHRSPRTDYNHYNDILGHPAGPNAIDLSLLLDYQPTVRLHGAMNLVYTMKGRNPEGQNYGGDPLASYHNRVRDFDLHILDGIRRNSLLVEAYGGYEFLPDLYLEGGLTAQSVDDAETGLDRYVYPFVMLRWGIPFQGARY